ncbi:hypothetical protein D9M71_706670 [compost metagenome]
MRVGNPAFLVVHQHFSGDFLHIGLTEDGSKDALPHNRLTNALAAFNDKHVLDELARLLIGISNHADEPVAFNLVGYQVFQVG